MALPDPKQNQAYFDVSALEAGHAHAPISLILAGHDESERVWSPSLAFLLRSPSTGKTIAFDLGIRKDLDSYPPSAYGEKMREMFPVKVPQDAADSLKKGGLSPEDVDYVMYSHLHWDHVGDSTPFSKAVFLVHHDAQEMCCPGYPEDAHSHVLSTQLPAGRTRFLQPDDHWQSLGPFTRAHDLFDDGSAFAVDTPGHCSGCQNLLVRTSPDGGWLFLAGDSAHDRRLLLGAPMALSENVDAQGRQKATMHHDRALAEDTIRRIGELLSVPRVRVIIAHDHEWYAENKDTAFFPGKIESL